MTENQDSQERSVSQTDLARLQRIEKWLTWSCYAAAFSAWAMFRLRISIEAALVFVIIALSVGITGVVFGRRAKRLEKLLGPTHGRCLNCDYDLAGLDRPARCPECGTPIVHPPDSNMR